MPLVFPGDADSADVCRGSPLTAEKSFRLCLTMSRRDR